MKTIKTTIYLLAAVGGLLACGSALAQDSTNAPAAMPGTNMAPHSMFGQPNMQRYAALDLTDAQKTQFQSVMSSQWQQMHAVFQDHTLARQDKMAKIKEIRSSTEDQIKTILTPDQFAKWQALQPPMRHMMMKPNGTNAPAISSPGPASSPASAP